MKQQEFKVTFWGVRGSRPVPGKDTEIMGGNTPCVCVEIGKNILILDSGTGICNLGNEKLVKQKERIKAYIFITHTHWDHIQGFPFFTPAYTGGNEITIYGQRKNNTSFADLIRQQMVPSHFPVQLEQMEADIEFIEVGSMAEIGVDDGITIKTVHNNHPGGCLSYRIDYNGKACCYITDNEHYSCIDHNLKSFAKDADMVIYDTNFTDAEYEGTDGYNTKIGWGHSTWTEGIKLARAANVDTLVLYHHATHRTDREMLMIEKEARENFAKCMAATEGKTIVL